jgi:hypothetical protein
VGLTAVRYILPFHKGRGLTIGHGSWRMVNADLGATIASIRQAVIEVMSLAAYLKQQVTRACGLSASVSAHVCQRFRLH